MLEKETAAQRWSSAFCLFCWSQIQILPSQVSVCSRLSSSLFHMALVFSTNETEITPLPPVDLLTEAAASSVSAYLWTAGLGEGVCRRGGWRKERRGDLEHQGTTPCYASAHALSSFNGTKSSYFFFPKVNHVWKNLLIVKKMMEFKP